MKRPLAFAGFSVAATLLLLNSISFAAAKIVAVIVAVLFLLSIIIKKFRIGAVLPTVFLASLFACVSFLFVYTSTVAPQLQLNDKTEQTQFEITDIPYKSSKNYVYVVKTKRIDAVGVPQNIKLKLYSKSLIDADYYDEITGSISYSSISDKAIDSYGNFGKGIFVTGYISDYTVTETEKKPVNYFFIQLRLKIKEAICDNLHGDTGGLALALLTGDRSEISDDAYSNFTVCGVTHIMSVSGLHTTVICMGIYFILKRIGIKRGPRTAVTLAALAVYAALSDFSTSVIRCAVMSALLIISPLFSKKADPLNSLGLSVIILCFNPFAVCDAGASLTVLSVLGILVVKPMLDKRLRVQKNKTAKNIYDGIAITASVIFATFPVMWLMFGSLSILSFLSNFIVIPLSELAMVGALLLSAFSAIPVISNLVAGFTYVPAKLMLLFTEKAADSLGFLNISIESAYFMIGYALILFLIGAQLAAFKKISVKITALIAAFSVIICTVFVYAENSDSAYMFISSANCEMIYNSSAAVVFDADSSSDYYFVKESLPYNIEVILYVDCDYTAEILDSLAGSKAYFADEDFSISLSEDFSVSHKDELSLVTIKGSVIKIDEKTVCVNDDKYQKSSEYITDSDVSYTYLFKNGGYSKCR